MSKHTPRYGWMKREWAKFPLGSKVKCIDTSLSRYGIIGTVIGYCTFKSSYAGLDVSLEDGTKISGEIHQWEIL